MKNIRIFYPETFLIVVVKFSVHLNRRVYIMSFFLCMCVCVCVVCVCVCHLVSFEPSGRYLEKS